MRPELVRGLGIIAGTGDIAYLSDILISRFKVIYTLS